jgi:hypothetical protein
LFISENIFKLTFSLNFLFNTFELKVAKNFAACSLVRNFSLQKVSGVLYWVSQFSCIRSIAFFSSASLKLVSIATHSVFESFQVNHSLQ